MLVLKVLYSTLLLLNSIGHYTSGELTANGSNNQKAIDINIPLGRDNWCRNNCESLAKCEKLYGNDHFSVSLKARYSSPGQHLFYGKLFGKTVTAQTFETQFVFDVSSAIQVSPCKIYVIDVSPERQKVKGHESSTSRWDPDNILIHFKIFNTTIDPVKELTKQVQTVGSRMFDGQVTSLIDTKFGVVLQKWDFSLKLMYQINVVGGEEVKIIDNNPLLNQGGLQWCEEKNTSEYLQDSEFLAFGKYCEFESYFRRDMALALSIDIDNINVLFIKPLGEDAVIISFRFIPLSSRQKLDIKWVGRREKDLITLVQDYESTLYKGNVTFRTDRSWGVSGSSITVRTDSTRLNRATRQSPRSKYSRCKDTQRCSRGWSHYNYSLASTTSTMQRFPGGLHEQIPLFADFEDWRQGTSGWSNICDVKDHSCESMRRRKNGTHWSPFDYDSLGPSIPTFNTSINSGLVLNSVQKQREEDQQKEWIQDITDHLHWIESVSNTTSLDANTRSRTDIVTSLTKTFRHHQHLLKEEQKKMSIMSGSQCASQRCHLFFNTSSLVMTGAVNATGRIDRNPDGTEVALWTFDSIDLGAEVEVEVTGQRAMAILSKTSVNINTTFIVRPGTLGGFPGGYSTFREEHHRLDGVCTDENGGWNRKWKCKGDHPLSKTSLNRKSNNVNGPGSPSVRYYSFRIVTTARIRREIQAIRTNANQGQTIEGGFILHYNGYSSSVIDHDVTATNLKNIMEDSLNPSKLNILGRIDRSGIVPGIGRVSVSRNQNGSSGGFEWRITFLSAIGNIGEVDSGPMLVTNFLRGIGASATIDTIVDGNTIGGTFAINFLNSETRHLPHDASSLEMELALVKDVPDIINATVSRLGTNPNCNDGFCKNGPDQAGGYTWEVSISTNVENISPLSPTSPDCDKVGIISLMKITNNLTGCVESICPNVSTSTLTHTPYSLSYGGGGGSFGGRGGGGFSYIARTKTYGDNFVTNLLGGSGGGLGLANPNEVQLLGLPAKVRGGSGGGAIAIIAHNDIVLGENSAFSCNGENGWGSFMTAGGGGSGGSILLSAGGTVQVLGRLEVRGGHGGASTNERKEHSGGGGGGGGGGRIAIYGESISVKSIDTSGGTCQNHDEFENNCRGENGSFYQDEETLQRYSIDKGIGAMETRNSLLLHSFPTHKSLVGEEPRRISGPIYEFVEAARPERVSFFVRASCRDKVPSQNWGALFSLVPPVMTDETSTSLGISVGSFMKHGVINSGGFFRVENEQSMENLNARKMTHFDQWYKIDVHLDWFDMVYSIHIDDFILTENNGFNCTSIKSVSLTIRPSNVDFWFDELYVGNDSTLGFRCPNLSKVVKVDMPHVGVRDWQQLEIYGENTEHEITHHISHLSLRQAGLQYSKPTDKAEERGHRKFTLDVKNIPHESNRLRRTRKMRPGDILKVNGGKEYFQIWYGEHQLAVADKFGFTGGVGACSTADLKNWKNEGIILHNMNVTDMVKGSKGPFHVEKPKVLYNSKTRKYVMWMIVDNTNRTLALAGVATSDYATGPFTFVRSFYPDGNKTRDQTIHKAEDGAAYLIRTYYDIIEYVLPAPVMQPIWESVKNIDGSTNFPLTYHRAHYEEGYDNYHDIYLQRWRGEDKPWKVICVDRITRMEREIPYGATGDEQCTGPSEFKEVIGQGDPLYKNTKDGIRSRFLDPKDPSNNVWKPGSVPGVKTQSWKANYEAGTCGLHSSKDDIGLYDPNLDQYTPKRRSDCSHVADNPIYPTSPDQLHGKPNIVEKRKVKFIAVSQLTFDYLDTNGVLSKFEGELEDGADLSFLINRAKENVSFGWESEGIGSTFTHQVHHPSFETSPTNSNFDQYDRDYNDKSFYSLQCVVDGDCPSREK